MECEACQADGPPRPTARDAIAAWEDRPAVAGLFKDVATLAIDDTERWKAFQDVATLAIDDTERWKASASRFAGRVNALVLAIARRAEAIKESTVDGTHNHNHAVQILADLMTWTCQEFRTCHDCQHVARYIDNTLPACRCAACGSDDTRPNQDSKP